MALCDVDDRRAAPHVQPLPQRAEVPRLPADAGQGRQEHRRRDRRHAGSHARHRGHVVHGARQARVRAKAAGAHDLGSAPTARGRREIQGRHADGQPGLFQRRHAAVRRDHLERRHRRGHRSPRLERPSAVAARPDRNSEAGSGSVHSGLGPLARRRAKSGRSRPTARPIPTARAASSTSRSTGAASTTSAAARWATWRAISWARRTWRCICRTAR